MAKLTEHGEKRLHERCGVPKRGALRAAERALERGMSINEASGGLRRYLDYLMLRGDCRANNIKVYGGFVWLFREKVLITVLNVPPEHRKQAKRQCRKKGTNG